MKKTLVLMIVALVLTACGGAKREAMPSSTYTPVRTATPVPTPIPTPKAVLFSTPALQWALTGEETGSGFRQGDETVNARGHYERITFGEDGCKELSWRRLDGPGTIVQFVAVYETEEAARATFYPVVDSAVLPGSTDLQESDPRLGDQSHLVSYVYQGAFGTSRFVVLTLRRANVVLKCQVESDSVLQSSVVRWGEAWANRMH